MEDNKIDYLDDGFSFVALVDQMQVDSCLKTVNSARISYNKVKKDFDEKDSKLTSFLWDNEHTSPFRHSYFTFHIKLPLFVARQLMKYQVGSGFRTYEAEGKEVSLEVFDHFFDTDKGCSWNEISGRYTQTSFDSYIPKVLRSNPGHGNKQSSGEYQNPLKEDDPFYYDELGLNRIMENATYHCRLAYEDLVKNGVAREIARMFLPQNIYTEAYWTVSLQGIIHFLKQRLKKDAQFEIRMLALGILKIMEPTFSKLNILEELQ